jgi:hypothetical protein
MMNKYLNECNSCTDGENQQIRKMLFKQPIFCCYPSQASLAFPQNQYLFSKDPESILGFSWPNQIKNHLLIPEMSVVIAEDPEEELVFRKLGLMKCTVDYNINHIQAYHAAFFGNPNNQGIDKDQYDYLEQQIWYLYHKQDFMRPIVSACDPPFPVLFFPVAMGGNVLPAKQAVLPCFLGLEVSTCSTISTEPWPTNLIVGSLFQKIQELCHFQLFLLEMGCDLPSESRKIEPSINESYWGPLSEIYADSALLDIQQVDSKLVSDKTENMTVVERIKELVRSLTCLKLKDQKKYLEVLQRCQSLDIQKASKAPDGCAQKPSRRRQILKSVKWDQLISKVIVDYDVHIFAKHEIPDKPFPFLTFVIAGCIGISEAT